MVTIRFAWAGAHSWMNNSSWLMREIIAPPVRLISGVILTAAGQETHPIRWGEDPIAFVRHRHYNEGMNILLIMVVLLLLLGGGGFYMGGPVIGGSGLGLVLLICLVIYLAGGFRTTKR